jgi:hypothetical protein
MAQALDRYERVAERYVRAGFGCWYGLLVCRRGTLCIPLQIPNDAEHPK